MDQPQTQTKEQRIARVWSWYCDGMIGLTELAERLDRLQVRGGIGANGFTGYDYDRQSWVELR